MGTTEVISRIQAAVDKATANIVAEDAAVTKVKASQPKPAVAKETVGSIVAAAKTAASQTITLKADRHKGGPNKGQPKKGRADRYVYIGRTAAGAFVRVDFDEIQTTDPTLTLS